MSVASLYGVAPERLVRALPQAVERAHEDQDDPVGALPSALAAELKHNPVMPAAIHYFHGTRASQPSRFLRDGLWPLDQILDYVWQEIGGLVPELSRAELTRLRRELTAGTREPRTYGSRVRNRSEHGPCGHLLRDAFLSPGSYIMVDYLAGAEIAIDICEAIRRQTKLDALARYRDATTPCLVEFRVVATRFDGALAAALWYLHAAAHGARTANANWNYCGDGSAIAADDIVLVDTVE